MKKTFVIDTNVLLFDTQAIFKFAEHTLFIPFVVIEELDKFKKIKQNVNTILPTTMQKTDTPLQPKDYTNHSGGAEGSDIEWDKIGKKFGFVNNKHYWTETKTPHGNTEITNEDFEEGRFESAKAAKRNFGYTYSAMKDSRFRPMSLN